MNVAAAVGYRGTQVYMALLCSTSWKLVRVPAEGQPSPASQELYTAGEATITPDLAKRDAWGISPLSRRGVACISLGSCGDMCVVWGRPGSRRLLHPPSASLLPSLQNTAEDCAGHPGLAATLSDSTNSTLSPHELGQLSKNRPDLLHHPIAFPQGHQAPWHSINWPSRSGVLHFSLAVARPFDSLAVSPMRGGYTPGRGAERICNYGILDASQHIAPKGSYLPSTLYSVRIPGPCKGAVAPAFAGSAYRQRSGRRFHLATSLISSAIFLRGATERNARSEDLASFFFSQVPVAEPSRATI
ncbi:hypothetical protein QBC47DRAFT_378458, partial [Echria macrotheca]